MPSAQNICPECGKDYVQKRNLDTLERQFECVKKSRKILSND